VPVLALGAIIWAFPTPSIFVILNRVQEVLASNDCILRHVIGAFSWIFVQVDCLRCTSYLNTLGTSQTLRILEK